MSKPFETLREDGEEVTVRTGFEAVLRKKFDQAMPGFIAFDTDTIEKMEAFQFDDPWDSRRYFHAGDDQINGVGDGFARNTEAFDARVKAIHADFPVFGGVCEAHEMLWRIIGSENVMLWMGLYPAELARFIERLHAFNLGLVRAQIQAAGGRLDGMVIWGDVAYCKGMMFSPVFWRQHFKPGVKALIDECHSHGLPVIYHGCGNVNRIFEDFIELGVDAYNPLEAKAGMNVVDLRRRFGHRIGFCGNMDVMLWAGGTREQIREAVDEAERGQEGRGLYLPVSLLRTRRCLGGELRIRGESGSAARSLPAAIGGVRLARIRAGGASMKRYGMVIGLRPEAEKSLPRASRERLAGAVAMIRACNIANYSIYLHDGELFSYFEYTGEDFAADMARMAADPATQRWWALMKPMQEPLPDRPPGRVVVRNG